jgi:hypothetical protein
MWSARWGHAVTVFNQTTPQNHLTLLENEMLLITRKPKLLMLGGDDRITDSDDLIQQHAKDSGEFGEKQADGVSGGAASKGQFKNDVWYAEPNPGQQAGWSINGGAFNAADPEHTKQLIIKSQMTWTQSNAGKIAPSTFPYGPNRGKQIVYDDWIKCQKVSISLFFFLYHYFSHFLSSSSLLLL